MREPLDITPEELAALSADDLALLAWAASLPDVEPNDDDPLYGDLPYDEILDPDGRPLQY